MSVIQMCIGKGRYKAILHPNSDLHRTAGHLGKHNPLCLWQAFQLLCFMPKEARLVIVFHVKQRGFHNVDRGAPSPTTRPSRCA